MSEQDEIRLVPMRVAGTYSRGGLRLVTVADGHRAAWENGITEEEALELLIEPHVHCPAANKLRAAFQREPAS